MIQLIEICDFVLFVHIFILHFPNFWHWFINKSFHFQLSLELSKYKLWILCTRKSTLHVCWMRFDLTFELKEIEIGCKRVLSIAIRFFGFPYLTHYQNNQQHLCERKKKNEKYLTDKKYLFQKLTLSWFLNSSIALMYFFISLHLWFSHKLVAPAIFLFPRWFFVCWISWRSIWFIFDLMLSIASWFDVHLCFRLMFVITSFVIRLVPSL